MSYFINNSPRSPQAAFPPLFMKRGAKHRRCDGVSQDISPMKMRHCFILITYYGFRMFCQNFGENKMMKYFINI